MKSIDELREEIDTVDCEIVKQLNRRIQLVVKTGEYKKQSSLPVEDTAREQEILSNLDCDQLDEEFLRNLYSVIFTYSKAIQERLS